MLYDISFFTYKSQMDHICHVCSKEVGEAHTCKMCKTFVHITCGTAKGEKGYGQKVLCNICQNGTLYKYIIQCFHLTFPFFFFISFCYISFQELQNFLPIFLASLSIIIHKSLVFIVFGHFTKFPLNFLPK